SDEQRSARPMNLAKACWLSFLDWLEAGAPGTPPFLLWLALGPVWRAVPLARLNAAALGPWLLDLLATRQRAGLTPCDDWEVLQQDLELRPLTRAEALNDRAAWAAWRLEAELLRLLRLVEAPMSSFSRSGWLAWQVRYWALVITLARIS